jgi:3-hydroxyacyl-[acyl-carrier-protein] dehydratase
MLLVDAVTDLSAGQALRATREVRPDEPWFGDGQPGYPWALVLESWCQAASILGAWELRGTMGTDSRVPLFGAVSDARFGRRPVAGDVMEHRVRLVRALSDTWMFEGETLIGTDTVLSVSRVTVALRPGRQPGDR